MVAAVIFPIKQASILSLPKEILLRIFDEVYIASCDLPLEEEPTSKLADMSLFPQCLANVCKAWKELVRSVPHFATRVMVFVDEPFSVDELKGRFEDSRSLFIKVFVIRREYPETPDYLEKAVAREVVKALAPHIARCMVVVFDLLQSSSLPHMNQFAGQAPKLRTLRMQCRRVNDDEDMHLVSQYLLRTQPIPFLCPNLQYLDMHGHVFIEAVRIPQWEVSIGALSQKQLKISHLRNVPAQEFNLEDLILTLSNMGHLTNLILSDVELDHTSCLSCSPISIFIQNFEFNGLTRNFFTGFFAAHENTIDVSYTVIRNCQLGKAKDFSSWELLLENISAEEDLVEFISHWDGFGLRFKDCPGVDDRLLQRLAEKLNEACFYAPTLRQLEINVPESASALSIEAFKYLVLVRKDESELPQYDPLLSTKPLSMHALYITGYGAPQLSPEDKSWFKENVECFLWDTPPPPPDSPVIDGDYSSWAYSDFDNSRIDELVPLSLSLPPPTQSVSTDFELASPASAMSDLSPPSSPTYFSDDYCDLDWPEAELYL